MRIFYAFFLLIFLPLGSFAQTGDRLPEDKNVRKGILENGLTYYIRHNENPKNQASFYLAQKVGSLQEEESERGLAHLLEHMAFNGSEHFPGDRMITFLEENGIKYGSELNASTSFDETVYYIDNAPVGKNASLLDSCIQIVADWSGGVSLLDDEIDKERGVVKSEYIARNSAVMRQYDSLLPVVLNGSKYAKRIPIGLMSVVENCPYEKLREYYKKWYHPSFQGVIIVGDVDVDQIEKKVIEKFSKYKNPENELPLVAYGCPFNKTPIFAAAKDKEQSRFSIYVYFKFEQFPDNKKGGYEYLKYLLKCEMIAQMISSRLKDITCSIRSPFFTSSCKLSNYIFSKNTGGLAFIGTAKQGVERDCYKLLLREALRIKKYGFLSTELERVKKDILLNYKKVYDNRQNLKNTDYVKLCLRNFLDKEALLSPEDKFRFVQEVLNETSVDDVNFLINNIITDNGENLVAFNFSPEKAGQFYMTEDIYKEATKEVFKEKIKPYKDVIVNKTLLKTNPVEGIVESEKEDTVFGVKVLRLGNGAKVVLKQTDFKTDEILFCGFSFGGTSLNSETEAYNFRYEDKIMTSIGLNKFSLRELNKLRTGRPITLDISVNNESESISGSCIPADLDFFLQNVYCSFTSGGSNEEDFELFKQTLRQSLLSEKFKPQSVFEDTIHFFQYFDNPRIARFEPADVDKINLKSVIKNYKTRFSDASGFTFFFIGNFDEKTLKPLICKYLASLPSKASAPQGFAKGKVHYNTADIDFKFYQPMQSPESCVSVHYLNDGVFSYNLKTLLKFNALTQIVTSAMHKRIREELSIAYTTKCLLKFLHSEEEGFALTEMKLSNPVKPEYALVARKIMSGIIDDILENGVEESALAKVKAFMLKKHLQDLKDNDYWFSLLKEKYLYNTDLLTDFDEDVKSMTNSDIQILLEGIIKASSKQSFIMMPPSVKQKTSLD